LNGASGENISKPEEFSITDAPIFVNEAIGDYHLVDGSPCIDAGMEILIEPKPVIDYEGNTVPMLETIDIGPFEYSGLAKPSPPILKKL
jgi:hypothetical protein